MNKKIRIGTRGSPLALAQVEMVRAALAAKCPDVGVEVVVIKTSGDWKPEDGEARLSAAAGGKGLFAKEIEAALLAGEIDAAVHSMKDMDSHLPEGLVLEHMLPRADARDALLFKDREQNAGGLGMSGLAVSDGIGGLAAIPKGAIVGTASVRRAAFLRAKRPDLKIVPLRGNVQTRIEKLRGKVPVRNEESGGVVTVPGMTCTMLAVAGLARLGIADAADVILEVDEFLPAAGQGAVGIELRKGDENNIAIFSQINHLKTMLCVKTEREALRALDGSCHTPIGAHAVMEGDEMRMRVRVCSVDGRQSFAEEMRGRVQTPEEAMALGAKIGAHLKAGIPPDILEGILGRVLVRLLGDKDPSADTRDNAGDDFCGIPGAEF